MNLRVTGQTQINSAIDNIRRSTTGTAKFQDQISSGLKLKVASDDPAAFVSAAQARTTSRRLSVYSDTIADASNELNTSVSVLIDSGEALTRAKQLAQIGIGSDTSAEAYEALATEVDVLIERMYRNANTRTETGYLFGGVNSEDQPFTVATRDANNRPATIAYNGSSQRSEGIVGPNGQTVDIKYSGDQIFQRSGEDVFQSLISLRDDLRNTTYTQSEKARVLTQRLADVDSARNSISEVMGEQSASLAGMEAVSNRLTDLKFDAQERLGNIEGTDYVEAVLRLKENQAVFESSLAVSSRLLQPSLLQFLR